MRLAVVFPAGVGSLDPMSPGDLLVEVATDVDPPTLRDHVHRIRTTVPGLPAHDIGQLADV